MDGDGKIDTTGTNPGKIFTKPGMYTVSLYTSDSMGCTNAIVKKDYLRVIDLKAKFSADTTVAVCAPRIFRFFDSSYVDDPIPDPAKKVKIAVWVWDFGDGSSPAVITDPAKKNPGHQFIINGTFLVKLTVYTSSAVGSSGKGCSATYSIPITIFGPHSEFAPASPLEGCLPFTVKMLDKSKRAVYREWRLGDGTIVTSHGEDTVSLTYKKPGIFCPELAVEDSNSCIEAFPVPACKYRVIVHAPNTLYLNADDTPVCVNQPVIFKGRPDTGYKSWIISYGNGSSNTNTKPTFIYQYGDTGHYQASLTGSGAPCPDTAFTHLRVIDVKADFDLDSAARDTPVFRFINLSERATHYTWDFDDGTDVVNMNNKNPAIHEFKRVGHINICLTAYNVKDCSDKICKSLDISTFLFIPNVFTPNGDYKNNEFVIDIRGQTRYDLKIYNRWGERVFESNNKYYVWNGIDQRTGWPSPEGTYYYVFLYRFIGGKDEYASGTVTLIR